MANIFAITTATNTVKADPNGNAAIVFTATNSTSRPVRGVGKIEPAGNTQQAWLRIEGENERDFAPGGTQQFTVTFSKPPGGSNAPNAPQPAEKFPFSLNLYDVSNPDENFTEGPLVTVETQERKAKEPAKFPLWIIPVAAVLLIFAGIIGWLVLRGSGRGVEVPDVTTQLYTDAEKTLAEKGFKAEKIQEAAPDGAKNNVVFKQDPEGGTKADPETTVVKLTVPALTRPTIKPPIFPTATATAAPTVKPKTFRMTRDLGTDRWGSDYYYFTASNVEDCEATCLKDDRCKGYAFRRDDRQCWLKDPLPARKDDARLISGMKVEN